jgi:single-strand DNA-binding protein
LKGKGFFEVATRSLNKVLLIGNLTRDPELRYTPQGTAVVTFGLATNRSWTTEGGERREETEFHRIVAWNKLAELCAQLLFKGRRVFVEGRLSTRRFVGSDGQERQITEIVIDDMLLLDSKRLGEDGPGDAYPEFDTPPVAEVTAPVAAAEEPAAPVTQEEAPAPVAAPTATASQAVAPKIKRSKKSEADSAEDLKPEDIPF